MNLSLVGKGVKIPPFTRATMVVSPPKKSSKKSHLIPMPILFSGE